MSAFVDRCLRAAVACVPLLLASVGAVAAPIALTFEFRPIRTVASAFPGTGEDDRLIGAFGNGTWQSTSTAASVAAAAGGAASAAARQTSNFGNAALELSSEARISLAQEANANGQLGASAELRAMLEFDLMSDSNFVLTGALDTVAIATGGALLPSFTSQFLFRRLDQPAIVFDALTGDEAVSVSGFLSAGQYLLELWTGIDALFDGTSSSPDFHSIDGTNRLSMRLEVMPIGLPEPGSLTVVLLALALTRLLTARSSPGGAGGALRSGWRTTPSSSPA